MSILAVFATQFQDLFPSSDHGREGARRFILALQAILLPITASRTSNLLRIIATLLGVMIVPWARTIVTFGLLNVVHGRWCCLPLALAFYLRKATLAPRCVRIRAGAQLREQVHLSGAPDSDPGLGTLRGRRSWVVADSGFGNNGLLKPLRRALGSRAHLLASVRERGAPRPAGGRAGTGRTTPQVRGASGQRQGDGARAAGDGKDL